ncbi:IS3 family transposase [Streptomyces sp. NPDC050523]|uniref:IS3 family transposase n=1 Tax=Streptomyces sp. NPDC050523 TaxID=3365622 RepID=UPI0037AE4E56
MAGQGHSVERACRVLYVAESGYYAWRDRPPSARAVRHAWLTEAILGIHAASRGTYGFRRVHAELALGLGAVSRISLRQWGVGGRLAAWDVET